MDEHMLVGELSLDGTLRPVRGALSIAVCARRQGIPNLLVPADNAAEAAVTEGVRVFGMRHLGRSGDVISINRTSSSPRRHRPRLLLRPKNRYPISAMSADKPPPSARSKWPPPAVTMF